MKATLVCISRAAMAIYWCCVHCLLLVRMWIRGMLGTGPRLLTVQRFKQRCI